MGPTYLGVSLDEREELRCATGWDPGPEAAAVGVRERGPATAPLCKSPVNTDGGVACPGAATRAHASSVAFLVTHAHIEVIMAQE